MQNQILALKFAGIYVFIVLCPACARFLVRSGLVNEVEFLGLIPPKGVRTNEIFFEFGNYHVALPLEM